MMCHLLALVLLVAVLNCAQGASIGHDAVDGVAPETSNVAQNNHRSLVLSFQEFMVSDFESLQHTSSHTRDDSADHTRSGFLHNFLNMRSNNSADRTRSDFLDRGKGYYEQRGKGKGGKGKKNESHKSKMVKGKSGKLPWYKGASKKNKSSYKRPPYGKGKGKGKGKGYIPPPVPPAEPQRTRLPPFELRYESTGDDPPSDEQVAEMNVETRAYFEETWENELPALVPADSGVAFLGIELVLLDPNLESVDPFVMTYGYAEVLYTADSVGVPDATLTFLILKEAAMAENYITSYVNVVGGTFFQSVTFVMMEEVMAPPPTSAPTTAPVALPESPTMAPPPISAPTVPMFPDDAQVVRVSKVYIGYLSDPFVEPTDEQFEQLALVTRYARGFAMNSILVDSLAKKFTFQYSSR